MVRCDTRLILLGSLPGEMSLARRQYYGNPRNQFWRLVGAVIGTELADLPYDRRLEALLEMRIGLWDVVASGKRTGSLDASIREHRANPLAALAANLPELRAIGFNGATSARIGMRALAGSPLALVALPSSSPAYTLPFEAKLGQWQVLKRFL